jgi:hypothetical protein
MWQAGMLKKKKKKKKKKKLAEKSRNLGVGDC